MEKKVKHPYLAPQVVAVAFTTEQGFAVSLPTEIDPTIQNTKYTRDEESNWGWDWSTSTSSDTE